MIKMRERACVPFQGYIWHLCRSEERVMLSFSWELELINLS